MTWWRWLLWSDGGLGVRIALGAGVFVVLAIRDLRHNGRHAQRWREYVFLLVAVVLAMTYGVVNNLITSGVSWEYYYYGKELEAVLGPEQPPAVWPLRWEAAEIGMAATWSAGLILSATALIANKPRTDRPRLSWRRMYRLLPLVMLIAAFGAVVFAALGWSGSLNWMTEDFALMAESDVMRPHRFVCAWGANLGGYVGGFLGAAGVVWWIVRARRALAAENDADEATASQP